MTVSLFKYKVQMGFQYSFFLLCVIVLQKLANAQSGEGSFDCPSSHGFFRNTADCSSFYSCTEGIAEKRFCSEGLQFSDSLKNCDYVESASCEEPLVGTRSRGTGTPSDDVTCETPTCPCVYPSRKNCFEYYRCNNGTAYLERCSDGLLMNPDTLTCDYQQNVTCVRSLALISDDIEGSGDDDEFLSTNKPLTNTEKETDTVVNRKGTNDSTDEADELPSEHFISLTTLKSLNTDFEIFTETSAQIIEKSTLFNVNENVTEQIISTSTASLSRSSDGSTTPTDNDETDDAEMENTECSCKNCRIPDKNDCSKYFECINGRLVSKACDDVLLFNPEKNACDIEDNVQCPKSEICIEESGFFPDLNDCTGFVECKKNYVAERRKCPEGLYYNSDSRICDKSSASRCGDLDYQRMDFQARDFSVECDCESCIVPDSDDCTKYYLCLNNTAYSGHCEEGLLFNPKLRNCDFPQNVTCAVSSSECATPNGHFSDPKNCSNYYNCIGGVAYKRRCNGNFHFSSERKICENPCEAQCDESADCPPDTPIEEITSSSEDIKVTTDSKISNTLIPELGLDSSTYFDFLTSITTAEEEEESQETVEYLTDNSRTSESADNLDDVMPTRLTSLNENETAEQDHIVTSSLAITTVTSTAEDQEASSIQGRTTDEWPHSSLEGTDHTDITDWLENEYIVDGDGTTNKIWNPDQEISETDDQADEDYDSEEVTAKKVTDDEINKNTVTEFISEVSNLDSHSPDLDTTPTDLKADDISSDVTEDSLQWTEVGVSGSTTDETGYDDEEELTTLTSDSSKQELDNDQSLEINTDLNDDEITSDVTEDLLKWTEIGVSGSTTSETEYEDEDEITTLTSDSSKQELDSDQSLEIDTDLNDNEISSDATEDLLTWTKVGVIGSTTDETEYENEEEITTLTSDSSKQKFDNDQNSEISTDYYEQIINMTENSVADKMTSVTSDLASDIESSETSEEDETDDEATNFTNGITDDEYDLNSQDSNENIQDESNTETHHEDLDKTKDSSATDSYSSTIESDNSMMGGTSTQQTANGDFDEHSSRLSDVYTMGEITDRTNQEEVTDDYPDVSEEATNTFDNATSTENQNSVDWNFGQKTTSSYEIKSEPEYLGTVHTDEEEEMKTEVITSPNIMLTSDKTDDYASKETLSDSYLKSSRAVESSSDDYVMTEYSTVDLIDETSVVSKEQTESYVTISINYEESTVPDQSLETVNDVDDVDTYFSTESKDETRISYSTDKNSVSTNFNDIEESDSTIISQEKTSTETSAESHENVDDEDTSTSSTTHFDFTEEVTSDFNPGYSKGVSELSLTSTIDDVTVVADHIDEMNFNKASRNPTEEENYVTDSHEELDISSTSSTSHSDIIEETEDGSSYKVSTDSNGYVTVATKVPNEDISSETMDIDKETKVYVTYTEVVTNDSEFNSNETPKPDNDNFMTTDGVNEETTNFDGEISESQSSFVTSTDILTVERHSLETSDGNTVLTTATGNPDLDAPVTIIPFEATNSDVEQKVTYQFSSSSSTDMKTSIGSLESTGSDALPEIITVAHSEVPDLEGSSSYNDLSQSTESNIARLSTKTPTILDDRTEIDATSSAGKYDWEVSSAEPFETVTIFSQEIPIGAITSSVPKRTLYPDTTQSTVSNEEIIEEYSHTQTLDINSDEEITDTHGPFEITSETYLELENLTYPYNIEENTVNYSKDIYTQTSSLYNLESSSVPTAAYDSHDTANEINTLFGSTEPESYTSVTDTVYTTDAVASTRFDLVKSTVVTTSTNDDIKNENSILETKTISHMTTVPTVTSNVVTLTSSSSKDECDSEGSFAINDVDCTTYYQCISGKFVQMHCPDGFHFSSLTSHCEVPCDAKCDTTIDCRKSETTTATSIESIRYCRETGLYPVPDDCSKYYNCSYGVSTVQSCSGILHFNVTTRTCDWPVNAKCGSLPGKLRSSSSRCYSKFELKTSKSDCSSYYLCINRRNYKLKCSRGLLFDASSLTCVPSSEAHCSLPGGTTIKTTSEKRLHCEERYGLFKNPYDCGFFMQCSNWQPYVMRCPKNLHFNEQSKVCDYPCDAKCDTTLACSTPVAPYETKGPVCTCSNCLLPSLDSCDRYILCHDGKPRRRRCSQGKLFDRFRKRCDWAERVSCPLKVECPRLEGLFEHSTDCHKFIHCSNGVPYIKSCPDGLEFHVEHQRCEWATGRCTKSTSTSPEYANDVPACPEPDGYFSSPKNCSEFIQCVRNKAVLRSCPPTLMFNSDLAVCDWPKNARCGDRQEMVKVECRYARKVRCFSNKLMMPYPDDCSLFYDCSTGTSCLRKCPDRLVFDSTRMICDVRERSHCTTKKHSFETQKSAIRCDRKRRLIPDTRNKQCFFRCVKNRLIRACCRENAIFDENFFHCRPVIMPHHQ